MTTTDIIITKTATPPIIPPFAVPRGISIIFPDKNKIIKTPVVIAG